MNYIETLELQVKNNQQAVYDMSQVLTDYVEMRGKSRKLNAFMRNKRLGSNAQIPTGWSVFINFIKINYLKLKKVLAFWK